MKNRILPFACSTALAVAFTVSLPRPAHAERVTPPPVPAGIEVPAGNRAFLVGHAVGSQNYVCLPSGSGFAWTLFTPQATLFTSHGRQLITHFFSPNPFEGQTIRPAWQHSRDTSTVWARLFAPPSSDSAFVRPGAIPWLVLEVVPPPGRAPGRRGSAVRDQLHPAGEHLRRGGALGGLPRVRQRRADGVRPLHGRLLLLRGRSERRGRGQLEPPREEDRTAPRSGPPARCPGAR
jgi:hypothetical protein